MAANSAEPVSVHHRQLSYPISQRQPAYSGKSIRAEHEYVLHTAVLEFVQYAEPEFRAFVLTDCYGQHFLVSFLADIEDNVCRLFAYNAVVTDVEYDGVDIDLFDYPTSAYQIDDVSRQFD